MKEIMKDVVKSVLISIGISMTIFCLTGIALDIRYDGNFSLDHYRFTRTGIWRTDNCLSE